MKNEFSKNKGIKKINKATQFERVRKMSVPRPLKTFEASKIDKNYETLISDKTLCFLKK